MEWGHGIGISGLLQIRQKKIETRDHALDWGIML